MPEKRISSVVQNLGPLPDPLLKPDGSRVSAPDQWPEQAKHWLEQIIELEYGGFPPTPSRIDVESLCHSHARTLPGSPRNYSYRIRCSGGQVPISFTARILLPDSDNPVPAIVTGDACWQYATESIIQRVLEEGLALIQFNRTEFAEDLGYGDVPDRYKRSGGLYDAYPDGKFGAVAAWAWGYHRIMDALPHWPFIDSTCIAITGHSRGGKATLVAGATDPRIALINENGSGAGGSAPFRYVGAYGESIDILNQFPSWFGTGLRPFLDSEANLPFDQNCLLASICPRPLLTTFSVDDLWSNPEGMVLNANSVREVYTLHGAEDNHAFHLRKGPHFHDAEDWEVLLDFINWKWRSTTPKRPYNQHPYTHLISKNLQP